MTLLPAATSPDGCAQLPGSAANTSKGSLFPSKALADVEASAPNSLLTAYSIF